MTARVNLSDVEACRRVARDEVRGTATLELRELDALCDAARVGVVAAGPEVKGRIESVLVELRTRAAITEEIPIVYRQMIAWSKMLERVLVEIDGPHRPPEATAAAVAADELVRSRAAPRCLWAKAAEVPGFTEYPVTMGSLVAIVLPPNCVITDDSPALVPNPAPAKKGPQP